jgi:hypothetical protein
MLDDLVGSIGSDEFDAEIQSHKVGRRTISASSSTMLNDLVSSIGSDEFDAEIQFHSVG